MSTRIYNGYRLPSGANLAQLGSQLADRMQPVWRRAAVAATVLVGTALVGVRQDGRASKTPPSAAAMTKAVAAISSNQLQPKDVPILFACSTVWAQAAAIVEALQERLSRPNALRVLPALDLTAQAWFVPDPRGGRWTYATWYSEIPEFQQIWESIPGLQPWPYWNNTDRPANLSDRQWGYRGRVWDRVLHPGVGVVWRLHQPSLWVEAVSRAENRWLTVDAGLAWLQEAGDSSECPAAPGALETVGRLLSGPAVPGPQRRAARHHAITAG